MNFFTRNLFKLNSALTAKVTKDNLNATIRTIKVLKRVKIEVFLRIMSFFYLESSTLDEIELIFCDFCGYIKNLNSFKLKCLKFTFYFR